MKKFEINYKIMREIRPGSPYNLAELIIVGDWDFTIKSENNWQDLHAWSPDGNYLAQVKWEIEHDNVGFRIVIFHIQQGQIFESEIISGCCNKLEIKNNSEIKYESFAPVRNLGGVTKFEVIKGNIKSYLQKAFRNAIAVQCILFLCFLILFSGDEITIFTLGGWLFFLLFIVITILSIRGSILSFKCFNEKHQAKFIFAAITNFGIMLLTLGFLGSVLVKIFL